MSKEKNKLPTKITVIDNISGKTLEIEINQTDIDIEKIVEDFIATIDRPEK